MEANITKRRNKIKLRIRKKMKGTALRPRLTVFRSNKEMYAQLVDDCCQVTLVAASSKEKGFDVTGNKTEVAAKVGKLLASRASAMNISEIVFDRNGYLYHGRVKALADGAREGGLKF